MSFQDRGWEGGRHIQNCLLNPQNELVFHLISQKIELIFEVLKTKGGGEGGNLKIVSRRQKMSIIFLSSIPYYWKFWKIISLSLYQLFFNLKMYQFFISLHKIANFLSVWILSVAWTFSKSYQFNFIHFPKINANSWSIVDITNLVVGNYRQVRLG